MENETPYLENNNKNNKINKFAFISKFIGKN